VWFAQRSAVACVEGSVPLFVLVPEPHDDHVGLFDECSRANGIDLRGLMVTPELTIGFAQMIAGSVASRVIGYRCGKHHVPPGGYCTALNFVTPIGVNLARKIDRKSHDFNTPVSHVAGCVLRIRLPAY